MSTNRLGRRRAALTAAPFAVLALMLLSACGGSPVASASSSPEGRADAPTTSATPGTAVTLSPAHIAEGAEVLVIGDSYTEGYGIAPGTDWAHIAAADRGWQATIDGVSGTGFTQGTAADGRTGLDYASRVHLHAEGAASYDLVVLQGGLNDLFVPADTERDNVIAAVDAARAAWPEADVIVFGPTGPFGGVGNRDESGVIRTSATDAGALSIDPVTPSMWLDEANSPEFDLGDGLHLNEAGQEYLAARFVEAVLAAAE
ncbi:SGNH/GDSL hydrolase family protein [Agromyces sp. NPDC056379]|uniref:SGNH/GDSL hydrolase family protein n=1 Tax=unclassified Agromyces TaxID=2639701 RepID=UPI0035D90E2F